MSSKDKVISSKLKSFFKQTKPGGPGGSRERTLRPEIERELRPEQPAAQRCKALKDLGDLQLHKMNLDETTISSLWDLTKDLIVPNKPAEYRQIALSFYKKLIYTQYKNLTIMRENFFLVIQNHEVHEDLKHRLDLLDTLTENGKDINNFEERIGKFMLHWLPAIAEANLLRPYLDMMVNLIKFNAAHLDNEIVVGIVQVACNLSCSVEDDEIGLQCLTILEMVMCYTIFPSEPLPQCVVTLCRTVNHGPYCKESWKIMRNLLGTQLGYHSMKMMCNILNDRSLYEDQQLLRGAVFHLNMNVFGPNVIFQVSPMFYAATVLKSFLNALDSRQVNVTFEVILSVRRVITTYKSDLSEIIWDLICDIMSTVIDNIDYYERINVNSKRLQHLQTNFHENIDIIEKLIQEEKHLLLANFERIYDLIERVAVTRPEQSVLSLIEYRSSKVTPTRPEWLQLLNDFVIRYYHMTNPHIRIKLIVCLQRIMDLNRACYEEEILERVVIPHFQHIVQEPEVQIREAVTKALVEFAQHCDTKRCGELLDILEKVINYPFEQYAMPVSTGGDSGIMTSSSSGVVGVSGISGVGGSAATVSAANSGAGIANTSSGVSINIGGNIGSLTSAVVGGSGGSGSNVMPATGIIGGVSSDSGGGAYGVKSENEVLDIIAAIDGLIHVFAVKLHRLPSCHAIKIFNILVGHLEMHYERPRVFEQAYIVRYKIFSWMLKARANALYQIGYPDPENEEIIKFSHYLGTDANVQTQSQQPRHPNVTHMASNEIMPSIHFTTMSIRRACKMIVRCLESDPDFQIFQLVIRELPKVLQNKALIQGNDIEVLASALFKVCQDGHKIYKRSTDEFHVLVLPAVASLVVYNQYLPVSPQSVIISILTNGFFSNIANVCINTMTTIILEMPEALLRNLPYILLTMSKMSDTTQVAIPVLEFLSILSRLSNNRFTNFVALQYMYVFAISVQFTKPYRFDHYTVLLAHHVIAGWFLKCKLEYRKHVVTYIISSIDSNVRLLYDDINKMNEDSTNRKRSTSLTERGSRNTTTTTRNNSDMRPSMNDRLKTFHAELADTCIDFLARHTFSPCSALPKRLPAVEYLLKDGLSQSWIVGHNVVTITTSGCPSAPNRNGLCDRCAQLSNLAGVSGRAGEKPAAPLSPEVQATAQTQNQQPLATQQQQPAQPQQLAQQQQQQQQQTLQQPTQTLSERRYTKVSLQHSSGNESAGSTDLTSSSSSTSTTQRQTSNSSTASLEAISRRGSNPDAPGGDGAASGSTTSLLGNTLSATSPSVTSNSQSLFSSVQQPVCIRSCTGWAEVMIRRPTGNVSWIMRIQNPISNDCFGQDMPFSNMVSLFLPTAQGGVFGPDFLSAGDVQKLLQQHADDPTTINIPQAPLSANIETKIYSSHESLVTKPVSSSEDLRRSAVKVRPLQRQEEVSSSSVVTAAIDIPKATIINKRKEALSGSVSDGEADESGMAFDSGHGRARNPVRRVNSSPEMSSSWRHTFLADKPSNAFAEELMKMRAANNADADHTAFQQQPPQQQQLMQQKKKSVQYSTKDMRVSCEAIPEEIAGSTPPQQQPELQQDAKPETPQPSQPPQPSQSPQPPDQPQNLAAQNITIDNSTPTTAVNQTAGATSNTATTSATTIAAQNFLETTTSATNILPPKQRSADDISITETTTNIAGNIGLPITVQQSSSTSSLKSHPALDKLVATKPPLSPLQASAPTLIPTTLNPMAQLYDKHINPVLQHKTAAFSATLPTPIGLTKSNSSGGASGLGAHVNAINNASSLVGNGSDYNNGGGNNGGDMMRERSKTISVVREVNNGKARANFRGFNASKPPVNSKLCMNPSFVFLQLYNTGQLKCTDVPIKVPQEHTNALNILDLTPPFETHKIGVLYVGQGQCNNVVEILRNSYGSTRYVEFLRNIGTLVSLKDARQQNIFMCLDSGGADGKFTYVWKDDIVQVIFQVATLMPTNLKTDPNCNEKKKHVGNDYVNIVYNESGEEYNLNTISGQFNYACVIVEPLELNTNRIYVKARPEISDFVCHPEPKIVSDRSAPMLARQLALHANLASQVYWSLQKNNPYGSNWLERLRCIKRLRTKLLMESQSNQHPSGLGPHSSDIDNDSTRFDFTRYT